MAHSHAPSQVRALLREAKDPQGRPWDTLVDEAAAISDPGHAAEALARLAALRPAHQAPDAERVVSTFQLACERLSVVDVGWRRAEVLGAVAAAADRLDEGLRVQVDPLVDAAVHEALELDPDATVRTTATTLSAATGLRLLPDALAKTRDPGAAAKNILRNHAASWSETDTAVARQHLEKVPDGALRARLLAYLDSHGHADAATAAARTAWAVPDPEKQLDALQAIIRSSDDVEALEHIIHEAPAGVPANMRAAAFSACAGRADAVGDPDQARTWFDESAEAALEVEEPGARVKALLRIVPGLVRLEDQTGAFTLLDIARQQASEADLELAPKLHARIDSTAHKHGLTAAPGHAQERPAEETGAASDAKTAAHATPELPRAPPRRHVLGLVDTYSGGLGQAHLRALGRAAPLAAAFGLDLWLIDWPEPPEKVVERTARESRIAGGNYAQALLDAGRLRAMEGRNVPTEAGRKKMQVVATTPKPDPERAIDLARSGRGAPLCLLVGLGPKGLPGSLVKAARAHYEITGAGIALETATALAVLAERLRAAGAPAIGTD